MKNTSRTILSGVFQVVLVMFLGATAYADTDIIAFDSERWVFQDAEVAEHLGRKSLMGTAYLKDVEFTNGVVEVDIAMDGSRSYPGIIFRVQSSGDLESFYLRPHTTVLYPDVLQYTPVYNSTACWQLFNGPGFTASAAIPKDRWLHVKMEIHGTQARVYLDGSAQPALEIHNLKHGLSRGTVGVSAPKNRAAYFSNFAYRIDNDLEFSSPPESQVPDNVIAKWAISRSYPAQEVNQSSYPTFFTFFRAKWQDVTSEPSGLVNISKYVPRANRSGDCVFARTVFRSEGQENIKLSFGYSDDVSLFLNGRRIYSGRSGYRSRHGAFAGIIGFHDDVYLPLQKGHNEIFLMLTERFGGCGFMCKADRPLNPPIKEHERLTKVWETPADLKIPESALYDEKRDVLYVTSYSRLRASQANTGFVSKVRLDGTVQELKWVTGLDGPCGMAILGETLYVIEGPRRSLVEIDIEKGEVVNRYAMPTAMFLNDIAIDNAGDIYVSNTSRPAHLDDIYKFKNGNWEIWKQGDDIDAANGLFVHGNRLLVGSSGDGLLKAIDLDDGEVTPIACFGGGIVDGIRVDNEGNYLVSQWKGQVYSVSPTGKVVEILNIMREGLNSADIEFVKDGNLLIIPTFFGNKVVAYRLGSLD